MGPESYIVGILTALLLSCGPTTQSRKLDQPTLEQVKPRSTNGHRLGVDAAPGFFRPCQIVAAGEALVEVHCDKYRLVEFRKAKSDGSADLDLDALLRVLTARFGEFKDARQDAAIDSLLIRLSRFKSEDPKGPQGMGASISNAQGAYWTFACYTSTGAISEDFCGDAIATAARAGGLAYVQAKTLVDFGEGLLNIGADCQATPGSRISCPSGQLSWSPLDGREAASLRQEALGRIADLAKQEKVELKREDIGCQLLGQPAECLILRLASTENADALNFVLTTGGGQERLVVCSYPNAFQPILPRPCGQAIVLDATKK